MTSAAGGLVRLVVAVAGMQVPEVPWHAVGVDGGYGRLQRDAGYSVSFIAPSVDIDTAVTIIAGWDGGPSARTMLEVRLPRYQLSGSATGIAAGGSLVLTNRRADAGYDTATISANGRFVFPREFLGGDAFDLTISAVPSGQTCGLTNPSGVIRASNVSNVEIRCVGVPTLVLTPRAIKLLHFSWADVHGETKYQLLESEDGVAPPALMADLPSNSTAHDVSVSLVGKVRARYILRACNETWCADSQSLPAGSLNAAIGYLKSSNTNAEDNFGSSVSLSGDGRTLVVGAFGEDSNATSGNGNQLDNSASAAGAVYVYTLNGSNWVQQAYLKASNSAQEDRFGFGLSVSFDGNVLAVAAAGEDSGATGVGGNQADNSAPGSGAVYVFRRMAGVWSQEAYLKASNSEAGDGFGWAVSVSGDGSAIAVGAFGEASAATGVNGSQASNAAQASGATYVFRMTSSAWTQEAYIKASNAEAGDGFGHRVALSADGSTLAVSALGERSLALGVNGDQTNNGGTNVGAAYVFIRQGGNWSQQAYVKASNAEAGDAFGNSLALSDDGATLVVGADQEASASTGVGGVQLDNSLMLAGAAYVFTRTASTWMQQAYIKATNTGGGDYFGSSVALSGDGRTLAVGAFGEMSNARGLDGNQTNNLTSYAGAAYVYTLRTTWVPTGYIKASNSFEEFNFGTALSLSRDGTTLAVSAPTETSGATGVGGNQADQSSPSSGAVYLY